MGVVKKKVVLLGLSMGLLSNPAIGTVWAEGAANPVFFQNENEESTTFTSTTSDQLQINKMKASPFDVMAYAKRWKRKVHRNPESNKVEFISGQFKPKNPYNFNTVVQEFVGANSDVFKVTTEDTIQVMKEEMTPLGDYVIRTQQFFRGVPVYGSTQVLNLNQKGVVTAWSGGIVSELNKQENLNKAKNLSQQAAIQKAEHDLGFIPEYYIPPAVELVIYMKEEIAHYAYHVNLNFLNPQPGNWDYFIDANDGTILNKVNRIHQVQVARNMVDSNQIGFGIGVHGDKKQVNTVFSNSYYYLQDNTRGKGIYTYDAKNSNRLPGTLWRNADNQFTAKYDGPAVDAHYYAGVVYDYYKNKFNRNSYDGAGAPIKSTVHYGKSYTNAFWNSYQMVYGDGDGSTYPFSGALDVVGHELTHAVTEKTANLIYENESGALNEAMSDIFGTLIEYYNNQNPDWEMGEDLSFNRQGFRSLADPTKYGDPDHYSKRYRGSNQNYLVHTNSGIINKAAYLISEGGTHYGVTVNGIGKEKLGNIFYRALTQYLTESATFSQMRAAALQAATDLYGAASAEVISVGKAFDAVGVNSIDLS